MKKDNYKAKWLAALDERQIIPTTAATQAKKQAEEIHSAQVNTTLQLQSLHTTMIDAALNAKSICDLMDESQVAGGVDFGSTGHLVDSKLHQMDMIVIARRVRDILKIAEARIGFLAAACDNAIEANSVLVSEVSTLRVLTNRLEQTAVESFYVGKGVTRMELDDLNESQNSSERFHRFGVAYNDLDENWLDTQLTSQSTLREHRRTDSGVVVDSGEEDEDSDDDDRNNHRQLVAHRNRQARVHSRDSTRINLN